jgi:hypothetical protein
MSSLEYLKERLRVGQRFLVVSGDRVELAGEDLLRTRSRAGSAILLLVDLRRALQSFTERIDCEDRHFSLMQIAQLTGMPYQKAWKWLSNGLLTASIDSAGGHGKERIFSCFDAFVAWVLVSLRKQGLAMTALARVAELLRQLDQAAAPEPQPAEVTQ